MSHTQLEILFSDKENNIIRFRELALLTEFRLAVARHQLVKTVFENRFFRISL